MPDAGRVAGDNIEAAPGQDLRGSGLPTEGFRMNRRVADDAVAFAEGVAEAGQPLAAAGV